MDFKTFLNKVVKGLKWFFFSYIWIFVLFFVIDLVTKLVIVNHFRNLPDGSSIVLIGTEAHPWLQISYAINTKAAFGFGMNNELANRIVYCIVAFLGAGILTTVYIRGFKKFNGLIKASLMLMVVGAIGNLVDRLFYTPSFLNREFNGVVDWIDFRGIWPFVFNIADSCVVIGTLIIVVYLIIDEIKSIRKQRAAEVKEHNGEKVLSKEEQTRLENEEVKTEEKVEETPKE